LEREGEGDKKGRDQYVQEKRALPWRLKHDQLFYKEREISGERGGVGVEPCQAKISQEAHINLHRTSPPNRGLRSPGPSKFETCEAHWIKRKRPGKEEKTQGRWGGDGLVTKIVGFGPKGAKKKSEKTV